MPKRLSLGYRPLIACTAAGRPPFLDGRLHAGQAEKLNE